MHRSSDRRCFGICVYLAVCLCAPHHVCKSDAARKKENINQRVQYLRLIQKTRWKKIAQTFECVCVSVMRNELVKSRKWGLYLTYKLYFSLILCVFFSLQFSGSVFLCFHAALSSRSPSFSRSTPSFTIFLRSFTWWIFADIVCRCRCCCCCVIYTFFRAFFFSSTSSSYFVMHFL